MNIDRAYRLIANLDYKETHRRYAPQYGLLQFNRHGEVVNIYRFKSMPTEQEQYESLKKHPGCLQIFTESGLYSSPKELQDRINQDLWLFSHMKNQSE